jgi:two-component system, CitB family, sensor kinase
MGASARRLSTQILRFQVLILVGTLLVGLLLAVYAARGRIDRDYELRALGVARTVAATPEIVDAVAAGDRSGTVQRRAEAIRRATGVAFVVIADRRGIRLSHPQPELVGQRVGTDPTDVLAGGTTLAVQEGASGVSARARIPLLDAQGRVIGLVSVGVLRARIHRQLLAALPLFLAYAGIALAIGLLASLVLARRLKRQTFGLELREIAELLQEREATLRGIREGVVAVDPDGRISVLSPEARRLLGLPRETVGRLAADVAPGTRLGELLTGRVNGEDLLLVHGERVLLASRKHVQRDGRDLGAVLTLRDRTEFEALARELDSMLALTDALRAQAHEFSNRLHTISGLLQLGHGDEALSFVREITELDTELRQTVGERIDDPRAAALVLAKTTVAAERGVDLRLADDLRVEGELTDPPAVLTVLGNLLDNALDAARTGERTPPWVELGLLTEPDGTLIIRVADSGPGVPPDAREKIFEPGYSTKPAGAIGERGVGLPLVRKTLERRGGTVDVGEAAAGGALFEARLPDALRPVLVDDLIAP